MADEKDLDHGEDSSLNMRSQGLEGHERDNVESFCVVIGGLLKIN